MNCQLCQEELEVYRKEKLPAPMKTQVEDHLKRCTDCTEVFSLITLTDEVINQEKEILSNPFLVSKIMTGIEKLDYPDIEPVPLYKNIFKYALITTSLAAAVFIGVTIGNIHRPIDYRNNIPVEIALMDDASIESVSILSNL